MRFVQRAGIGRRHVLRHGPSSASKGGILGKEPQEEIRGRLTSKEGDYRLFMYMYTEVTMERRAIGAIQRLRTEFPLGAKGSECQWALCHCAPSERSEFLEDGGGSTSIKLSKKDLSRWSMAGGGAGDFCASFFRISQKGARRKLIAVLRGSLASPIQKFQRI